MRYLFALIVVVSFIGSGCAQPQSQKVELAPALQQEQDASLPLALPVQNDEIELEQNSVPIVAPKPIPIIETKSTQTESIPVTQTPPAPSAPVIQTEPEPQREVEDTKTTTCVIKGNISSSGEKIYHSPGCRSYNQTIIDTSKGERWFCSDAEALNAGWRRALNC